MTPVRYVPVLVLQIALAASCGHTYRSAADVYYEAGAFGRATEEYRSEIKRGADHPDEAQRLFRLGLAQTLSRAGSQPTPASAPASALPPGTVQAFRQLLQQYPHSVYSRQARVLLRLHQTQHELELRLSQQARRMDRLNEQLGRSEAERARLRAAKSTDQSTLEGLRADREALAAEVTRLQQRISKQNDRIERLKRSLAALKKIDMRRTP